MAVRIGLGANDLSYAVDFGLPLPDGESMFTRDPEIKDEVIWAGPVHVEPPTTAPAASQHGRGAAAAESGDPVVILGVRPGQVWAWPW